MNVDLLLPIFPLKGVIFFPGTELPLNIFEKRYLEMIDFALTKDKKIGIIQNIDDEKIYKIGCVGKIISFNETEDNRYIISLRGENIFSVISELPLEKKFRFVKANVHKQFIGDFKSFEDSYHDKKIIIEKYTKLIKQKQPDIDFSLINNIDSPLLIKFIAMSAPFRPAEKQMLLEVKDLNELSNNIISLLDFYNNQEEGNETIN